METASLSPGRVTVVSGRYLHGLFNGDHGEMNDDPYSVFVAQVAARARDRRIDLGLETDDVARRITEAGHKLIGSSVANWERGDLPLKHVGRLADALEMDWRELLGLVPGAERTVPADPLVGLRVAVDGLVDALQRGTDSVNERLAAIERLLSAATAPPRPKGRGTTAGGMG
jgi:hypothetical protein